MQSQRHLKIFISSTFQDMQEEREILLKETFLELKKIAKQRGIEITEIDLRTGVTKEQAENGEIIKICIDEVARCGDSPIFFLGMLGNRYGSVDWIGGVDKNILEDDKYSWVKEHTDVSITEIEIISALERDTNHNRAFIYLKEGVDDNQKLTDLKTRLQQKSKTNSNLSVTSYIDSTDFREKTIDSFTKALDELYPKDEKISEVERLRASHEIFAKSRQKVYIPHRRNESILDEFIESSQDRLLLYGESGLGKSALIANYFEKFKKRSDVFVIEHYIGGAGELSNDLQQMLRRVMLEIKEEFELTDVVPSEPQKIMDEFALWLHRVNRPTVIVLDGYNQIEDELKEKLFYYIPEKLERVKLIITSIKKSYPIDNSHQIEPLTQEEQRVLVVDYLKGYGKTIDQPTQTQIVEDSQTNNTLFLRTLLNEIRLLGNFEGLDEDINNYLSAKDVVELFIKIFERLERDYRENLAKEVLSLLYVSRDGLSEDNLMEIINQNTTQKLTRLEFSPLFLAIEEHLINRGGLYGFFHDFIRLAVKNRYFSAKELVDGERRKIADYFEEREIDNQRVRELPFQLYILEDIDKLYQNLIDVFFIDRILNLNKFELLNYCILLDKKYNISIALEKKLLDKTFEDIGIINDIALFMNEDYIKYETSLLLNEKSLQINKKKFGTEHFETAITYNNLGLLYVSTAEYKKSELLYIQAIKINKKLLGEEHFSTIANYNNLATLYLSMGKYKKSENMYIKSIQINKKIFGKDSLALAQSYNNLGSLYKLIGQYMKAKQLYLKSLKIRKKKLSKEHPQIAESQNNIASVYELLGELKQAHSLYVESLQITKKTFGENHPSIVTIYNNLGLLYSSTGEYKKAESLCLKALTIQKNIFDKEHPSIATIYNSLAGIYHSIKEYKKAEFLYINSIKIDEKFIGKEHYNTAIVYANLAELYRDTKEFTKSEQLYLKALKIHRKILGENNLDTAKGYNNLGAFYFYVKRYKEAHIYTVKAIEIRKKLLPFNHPNLLNSKEGLIRIEKKLNKKQSFMKNLKEQFLKLKEKIK